MQRDMEWDTGIHGVIEMNTDIHGTRHRQKFRLTRTEKERDTDRH